MPNSRRQSPHYDRRNSNLDFKCRNQHYQYEERKSLSTQLFFNHRHNVHQTRRRRHAPALPHGDVGIRLRSARRITDAVLTADAPFVLCSSGGRVSSLLVSMQLYADAVVDVVVGGCALCVLLYMIRPTALPRHRCKRAPTSSPRHSPRSHASCGSCGSAMMCTKPSARSWSSSSCPQTASRR